MWKTFRRTWWSFALLAGAIALALGSAQAAPDNLAAGKLDPTFGKGGRVITTIDSISGARAVAIQPDGKIVAAGVAGVKSQGFALVRYRSNGSLDPTFGSKGRVTTRVDATGSGGPAWSLAVQRDGKIVAAGYGDDRFALARYKRNGKLDAGFGTGGIVRTEFSEGAVYAEELALQPDGKIVVVGWGGAAMNFVALARYNTNGTLDAGFGSGGKVTTATNGRARAVALQRDGKIVVAGSSTEGSQVLFAVVRYEKDGSLDPSFGSGGIVKTAFGSLDGAWAVMVQRDGKIVVVGDGQRGGHSGFALARYKADGTLDSTFGAGGIVKTGFGARSTPPTAAALQRDGKILVAGWHSRYPKWEFALARYRANGSLDRSFGVGGKITTSFKKAAPPSAWPREDTAWAVAVQPNGKIVVAGDGGVVPPRELRKAKFELARYLGVAASRR